MGNKITRRYHTGIIIFINNALISVFCKRQKTVESSTFGSEMVALQIGRYLVSELRIKFKFFGVFIRVPANLSSNNESLYKSFRNPESTLNKKHNPINYQVCHEAVTAKIMRVVKEDTHTNPADAFTKIDSIQQEKGFS